MAAPGPIPKRSSQRRRTNSPAPEKVTGKPAARGTFTVPLADGSWHPTAKKWYQSLRYSGQSAFYEASDWMEAYVAAEVLSAMLTAEKLSAMLFASWSSHTARLLVTEGDRRRMRIELEKPGKTDPDRDAGVASMQAWRKKLAAGSA
jgi:hypothetical protein